MEKAPFVTLVTDVLPFDVYSDYIKLNERDYANPIAKGWNSRYEFDLLDEVLQGVDTVYILAFRPKKTGTSNLLSGQVYIHSDHYAIISFIGKNEDPRLNRVVKIEQQYDKIDGRWFPKNLNYEMIWNNFSKTADKKPIALCIKGTSKIDSVQWQAQQRFRFDKSKTLKLLKNADEQTDSAWSNYRPHSLTAKDSNTYVFMDSLFEHTGLDKTMPWIIKLSEGKIPVSILDLNIQRLYTYNKFEGNRLGLGLQTNEKISERLSLGGLVGRGFRDKDWKYGGFAEFYLDKYRDKVITMGYSRDLQDPGRIRMHKDIDKGYLQMFLMSRADRIADKFLKADIRAGYFDLGMEAHGQQIHPMYNYAFIYGTESVNKFEAKEGSVNFRYAYRERRALIFNRYSNIKTTYPIFYLKLTIGNINSVKDYDANYVQALTTLKWEKHLNRIGNEHFMIMAGLSESNAPLPLSKSFAGRGFKSPDYPLYVFGSFATMLPYQYYTDRFVSLFWKHDFDWKLFNIRNAIIPYISLAHNFLYGTMKSQEVHQFVSFSVPEKGYHESGLILNDLIKLNYLNMIYFNVNLGYFYHWQGPTDLKKNGNFVLSFSAQL